MIIQHDERGFITHIYSEPGNPESLEKMLEPDNTLKFPDDTPVGHFSHYVTNPTAPKEDRVIEEWKKFPADEAIVIKADGKDSFVVEGLLDPCVIILDGEYHTITGGKLEFSTTDAGTYFFESQFPYLPWNCMVVTK